MNTLHYLIYLAPMLGFWGWYSRRRLKKEQQTISVYKKFKAVGSNELTTLHPVIDANKCIGCGSCVQACPEAPDHQVLGLIHRKAVLIAPNDCIGHGACRAACPTDAITLAFGSEQRGVDIPILTPTFETTVPGIYIAGELGGMGLIRNAFTQGRQAIEAIHRSLKARTALDGASIDVVIVGGGPAGFAAALTAHSLKMKYAVLEQESLGGSIAKYPRKKLLMASAAELPLVGKIEFAQSSKEELLAFWQQTAQRVGLNIHHHTRVDAIQSNGLGAFVVTAGTQRFHVNRVLLAIGRRGTPAMLGVPGEQLTKVVYRLVDPDQYVGQQVLVVGGGDSALETAISIADANGRVTLSYRGTDFVRATLENRRRIEQAIQSEKINVLLGSTVTRITPDAVELNAYGQPTRIQNHAVIINIGGLLPTDFLRSIGIEVTTKYGVA
jgi:thioredoxin reductase (NADPH)